MSECPSNRSEDQKVTTNEPMLTGSMPTNGPEYKICPICQQSFTGKNMKRRVYCSMECRDLHYHRLDPESDLAKGVIGAIHEMEVCSDLLRKGWDVFRAISSHRTCSLIIVYKEQLLRVQVAKADRRKDGAVKFNIALKRRRYDILALSFVNRTIEYFPELPVIGS